MFSRCAGEFCQPFEKASRELVRSSVPFELNIVGDVLGDVQYS